MTRWVRITALALALVLRLSADAAAQATTGSVFGKVTDATGAVLPGVSVTISGSGLLRPVKVVTGTSGAYQLTNIPNGTYKVAFELEGFKTLVQEAVQVTTDANLQLNAKLDIGTVQTQMTVTAETPIVDTRSTKTGATFTLEKLQTLPSARDPFQVMNMTPGIIMQTSGDQPSGVNVAGSASGQQMSPAFRGSGSGNTQWNMDGGTITDMAATGAAPIYFDFDAFQEIQITTGAADASQQTAGININLITRSGSNRLLGSAHGFFTNKSFQSNNITPELFARGGTAGSGVSGSPMKMITDDGAEIGGPIKRDRAWFWGAYGYQKIDLGILGFYDTARAECAPPPSTFDQLKANQDCLKPDSTLIKNSNLKFSLQPATHHRFQLLYQNSNKIRNARGASATTLPENTVRQYSPGGSWQVNAKHTWMATSKLVFENQLLYVHNFFNLDFQDYDHGCAFSIGADFPSDQSCLFNQQLFVNRDTGVTGRSASASFFERPGLQAKSDANYFASHVMGGDHAIKFGIAWRRNSSDSYSHSGGFATARYRTRSGVYGPDSAILSRDSYTRTILDTASAYAQDSYNRGRMRVTLGVRWDVQDDRLLASCVPANPFAPNLLAAQCSDPYDSPVDFSDIAPRVSVIYDLFGNGRTALKASYAMYFDQGVGTSSARNNTGGLSLTFGPAPTSASTNGAIWTDLNQDMIVQLDELGCSKAPGCLPSASTSRWNPETGQIDPTPNQIDPNLKNNRTREAVAGIQHQLSRNLAFSVDYIWRQYDRNNQSYFIDAPYPPSSIYVGPFEFTDPVTGETATYWQVCDTCPRLTGATVTRNSPDYTTYQGVEISAQKRMSRRWQMDTSLTLSKARAFLPDGSFTDPTNIDKRNGLDGGTSNIRYVYKLQGIVQLPLRINFATAINVQDGFTRIITINGPSGRFGGLNANGTPGPALGQPSLEIFPRGANRYNAFAELDISFSRKVTLGRRAVTVDLDVFNALNNNTIRGLNSNLSQKNFDTVTAVVPPRAVRLGFRMNF